MAERWFRMPWALLLAGGLLVLSSCGGPHHTGEVTESRAGFIDHPALTKLTVDESFETVWTTVLEIVEERSYETVERDRSTKQKTYTTTVSRDDRPRDEQLRETVTEGRGTIVATTEDGREVPLELKEDHSWGMTMLDMLDRAGGGESVTLQHDGVEISVLSHRDAERHDEEIRAVFDEIRDRFGESKE